MRAVVVAALAMIAGCQGRPQRAEARHEAPAVHPDPPRRPARHAADPRIELALATRLEPVYVPPPIRTEPLGRCGVTLHARNAADGARMFAEFQRRNGSDFGPSAEVATGDFAHVVRYATRERPAGPAQITRDQALAAAAKVLVASYDLMGLDEDDLATAKADGFDRDHDWLVRIDGDRPLPGYEAIASFHRSWYVEISLGLDGQLLEIIVNLDQLHIPAATCSAPKLTPDAARQAIATLAGRAPDDVVLTVFESDGGGDVIARRLAYQAATARETYVIDADTGAVLAQYDPRDY